MIQVEGVQSLEEVRRLVSGVAPLEFKLTDRESSYRFITQTLVRFDYGNCKKADKGVLKAYMVKLSGLSRSQLTRLIRQHQQTGKIVDRRGCGPATRKVLRRMFYLYADRRYERLATLSNGHLYNLRKSRTYHHPSATLPSIES